jgi:phage terminase large subunit-like protein
VDRLFFLGKEDMAYNLAEINVDELDDKELDKLEKFVKRNYAKTLNANRIYKYAESLKIPTEDLEAWTKSCPVDGFEYPSAHKWQRYMTYPWENDKFERFKQALYFPYFAGNKGGKTVWLDAWIGMECLGIHPLQEIGVRPMPPVHWWIVSPNLPSESDVPRGEDAPIIKKFYEWVPESKGGKTPGIKKFYRKDKIMTVVGNNGQESVINWKSHDQDKGKFKSEDVDGIGWDEEPPKPLWEEGVPRTLTKKGIMLLAMTSDYGSWTWQLLKHINEPEYWICEMDSLENPFMPTEHRKKVLATMSEDELLMRRLGKHIQMKGKVFPFDYNRHVGRPFTPSDETTNYVIIDWHPAKPIIISYLSINIKNIWYVWQESAVEEHVVERVVKDINSKLIFPDYKLKIKKYIIDKLATTEQAAERGFRVKSIQEMLHNFGILCDSGKTQFETGGDASAQSFLIRKLNHQELFFNPSCKLHIEQFDTWGAKRYVKGNNEGTLRDQLEQEGNDTCMNLVYAYNAGGRYYPNIEEEPDRLTYSRPATSRIYGGRNA